MKFHLWIFLRCNSSVWICLWSLQSRRRPRTQRRRFWWCKRLQRPCNRWELYQSILALTNEHKFSIVINNDFDKMRRACALCWIMAARGLYSCLPPDQIPLMSLMVVVAATNCNCNLFFTDLFWGQGEVSAPLKLPRTIPFSARTGWATIWFRAQRGAHGGSASLPLAPPLTPERQNKLWEALKPWLSYKVQKKPL